MLGGSGSSSLLEGMPKEYPEHFEAGTLNTPGIIALKSAISYLDSIGMDEIEERIKYLTSKLFEILNGLDLVIYGCGNGIASFSHSKVSSEEIACELDKCNIAVRSGLHCSPLIHRKLGCEEFGTVRVSLSIFNNERDIDALYKNLKYIIKK